MEQFFNLLFSDVYGFTMFIYLCLFALPSLIARSSQPIAFYGTTKMNKINYFISFVVMSVGLVFADNGTDTGWYMNFFDNRVSFVDCEYGAVEIGFQYYNVLIHFITNDAVYFIIITRFIMMICVFGAIYFLRDKSLVWLSILGFAAVVYFQMFSALRNGLAYSMGFLVYAYCVKNKYFLAIIFAILGISIHRSMIMFVAPLTLFLLAIKLAPKTFAKVVVPVLLALIIVVYLYGIDIIQHFLMSDDVLMGKYDVYLDGESTQGVMIFFVYIPIIFIFLDYKYLKSLDLNMFYLNIFLSIIGFAFALLAYQIGQLARVAPYYSLPFLFYIGYYLQNTLRDRHLSLIKWKLFGVFISLYWFYRFMTFVSGLFFNNGLYDYKLFI